MGDSDDPDDGALRESRHFPPSDHKAMTYAWRPQFFGFSPSMGTIPYTTIELMPLEIRGVGTAISVGFQWAGNILMSSTFVSSWCESRGPHELILSPQLSLMNRIGPSGAFGL